MTRQISPTLRAKINRNIFLYWTVAGCMFHNKSHNIIVTTIWAIFISSFFFQNLNHSINQYYVFPFVTICYHTLDYLSIDFYNFIIVFLSRWLFEPINNMLVLFIIVRNRICTYSSVVSSSFPQHICQLLIAHSSYAVGICYLDKMRTFLVACFPTHRTRAIFLAVYA